VTVTEEAWEPVNASLPHGKRSAGVGESSSALIMDRRVRRGVLASEEVVIMTKILDTVYGTKAYEGSENRM
jgi:hypothetical protein